MKRDTTTLIVCVIVLGSVGLLLAPQIAAFRNPPTGGLPNQTANIAALTSNAMPPPPFAPTNIITSTVSITSTLSFTSTTIAAPTISITSTNALTPTLAPTSTSALTPTLAPTSTSALTPTLAPTSTSALTPTLAPTSTSAITSTGSITSTDSMPPIDDVKIQNFAYSPPSLIIPTGTTVRWTQLDKTVPHTVSAGSPLNPDPASPFNSGTLTADGTHTYEFIFQQPGIYPYYCTFHTEMRGAVRVANAAGNVPTPVPATPSATATPFLAPPPTGAQVVATGLINPRGFVRGPDGALYVAEAGTVPETVKATNPLSGTQIITSTNILTGTGIITSTVVATLAAPITPPSPQPRGTVNPICESQLPSYDKLAAGCPGAQGPRVSSNGRISRIAPDGTRTTIAENLPATVGPFNDVFGVNSVAFIGSDLYVIVAAGPTRGHPNFPTGVYRVANGSTTLVANLEEFQKQNPPKFIPEDYNYSLPYDVLALDGKLYITDGNAAVVFEVDPSLPSGSNIQRIVDLSPTHNVLTGISAGADGAIYFTDFTPAPYPVGGAQVFKWTPQDGLTTVTAGLSIATGMAVAPDGTMYASEFATDLGKAPFIVPPGRVVKIGADGTVETVAAPLVYPTALRWLDGALYVTNYGVNAVEGEKGNGEILRLELP